MAIANLVLRFFLEVGGVGAAGYAAYQLVGVQAEPLRWVAAIGAALAVIVFWALVVAPRTANGLNQTQKDLVGTAVLLVGACALGVAGQVTFAIGFGLIVAANAALLLAFGPDARNALTGVTS